METKLSQSLEDYLEMIHMLRMEGKVARVKDIADALSVKMPSVAKAIAELKKLGLVTQEPYAGVELTKEGEVMAASILNRHVLLKSFLMRLGVSEEVADKDACCMEHILSAETLSKIEDFVKLARPAPKRRKR
ncbi:metal-dependent transcriptional regulator [Fibrobacter sp.]|uniref:metal-dependent transcriptional regulator n=1 Tax=Fibrobacter sp. TaxID=35828 RepID=UPI003890BF19